MPVMKTHDRNTRADDCLAVLLSLFLSMAMLPLLWAIALRLA
jgi:hypothetical protein